MSRASEEALRQNRLGNLGLLRGLVQGEPVDVTIGGQKLRMTVSRTARPGDHCLDGARVITCGSWESTKVTVTLGPGRYSTEIGTDMRAGPALVLLEPVWTDQGRHGGSQ